MFSLIVHLTCLFVVPTLQVVSSFRLLSPNYYCTCFTVPSGSYPGHETHPISILQNVVPLRTSTTSCRTNIFMTPRLKFSHGKEMDSNPSDDRSNPPSLSYLKEQLTLYLDTRAKANADAIAKQQVGKIVGGTKGNIILEFVSGSPNKEFKIEDAPDVFDYDELVTYGFDHLVEPIMEAGGRREMYKLMEMREPPVPKRLQPKKVPKLVIDRTGETDKARYSGLKMSQTLDDDEIGVRLAEIERKKREGESIRKKLIEEEFEVPFAASKGQNVNRVTPDWTPEMLDEEGKRAGKAIAWARAARAGEFKSDPYEKLNIEGNLQVYSIISVLFVSFSFGRSSNMFFEKIGYLNYDDILNSCHIPAILVVSTAVLSSIICGIVLAPPRNRNGFIWFIKGLAGGPLAVLQIKELGPLVTRGDS